MSFNQSWHIQDCVCVSVRVSVCSLQAWEEMIRCCKSWNKKDFFSRTYQSFTFCPGLFFILTISFQSFVIYCVFLCVYFHSELFYDEAFWTNGLCSTENWFVFLVQHRCFTLVPPGQKESLWWTSPQVSIYFGYLFIYFGVDFLGFVPLYSWSAVRSFKETRLLSTSCVSFLEWPTRCDVFYFLLFIWI